MWPGPCATGASRHCNVSVQSGELGPGQVLAWVRRGCRQRHRRVSKRMTMQWWQQGAQIAWSRERGEGGLGLSHTQASEHLRLSPAELEEPSGEEWGGGIIKHEVPMPRRLDAGEVRRPQKCVSRSSPTMFSLLRSRAFFTF